MTAARTRAIAVAALVCGLGTIAIVLTSDRADAHITWAVFGPIVIWSFVGTGLYASRVRPESRVGVLMVLLGFAWCVAALAFANGASIGGTSPPGGTATPTPQWSRMTGSRGRAGRHRRSRR